MAQRVEVTREGMMVDQLVKAATGSDADGLVEETLVSNPGLASDLARAQHQLALGSAVTVPERSKAPKRLASIKLWD
jgi:phage tail protein X